MKRSLLVRVNPILWEQLGLDDDLRRFTVVCAFYNGYGVEKIKSLMTKSMSADECVSLRSTAQFLGIDESDDIIKEGSND